MNGKKASAPAVAERLRDGASRSRAVIPGCSCTPRMRACRARSLIVGLLLTGVGLLRMIHSGWSVNRGIPGRNS
mgnify:CR=1 FL=1